MSVFDWIGKKFSKEKDSEKKESIKPPHRCQYSDCTKEAPYTCRFCGKTFCDLHKDPISHDCGAREFVETSPRIPTKSNIIEPKIGKAPLAPKPNPPEDFSNFEKSKFEI